MKDYDFDFQEKNGTRLRGRGWPGQIALVIYRFRWLLTFVSIELMWRFFGG